MAALQVIDNDNDDDQVDSADGGGSSMDDNDTKTELREVPGLTDSQIQSRVDLEMSLANDTDVQKKLGRKKKN